MILTCPSCATRYFVKDDAVPAAGRVVRCASCATEWRAETDAPPLELLPEPSADEPAKPAPLPNTYRAKVAARRQTRAAVTTGAVWAGLSVAFVTVALGAVLFRTDVVRAFPRANAAYAAIRMPVNPTGLALDGVQGGPGLENGRQMLQVAGMLRNVEAAGRAPAALRVSLYDKSGHRVAEQRLPATGEAIAAGEARPFRAVFFDPPLAAAEFGVDFDWTAAPAPHKAGPTRSAAPAHTLAPAPAHEVAALPAHAGPVHEATALPADSPYALPTAGGSAEAAVEPRHSPASAVAHSASAH